MEHLPEEQLILHYYGESEQADVVDQHLRGCAACRTEYADLQRLLNTVDLAPVPERAPDYSAQVWSRLEPRLGISSGFSRWWRRGPVRSLVAAAAMAALVLGAFLAGRYMPVNPSAPVISTAVNRQVRERVLTVAVSDHLERSQMMLIELANAPANTALDIASERSVAENLVESNRLYRQTALATGDSNLAAVLDDLERLLIDIAHSPDQLTAAELDEIHQRIEAQQLLFKVRVLGTKLKAQQGAPLL
jgi:hypothetical protein